MPSLPNTKFELSEGIAELVMPRWKGEDLQCTCFRGIHCQEAGNFSAWSSFRDFLEDPEVRTLLAVQLERLVTEKPAGVTHHLEIEFPHDVGWDAVIPKEELIPEELEVCQMRYIDRKGNARALYLPDKLVPAMRTDTLTMVVKMKHDGHWVFIINTMYPGPDCGELYGNMTERKNLVWMHSSNPGE